MSNLQAIRERWAKATPGPWKAWERRVYFAKSAGGFDLRCCPQSFENAIAIASAPTDIAYLLNVTEAAQKVAAEVDLLTGCLAVCLIKDDEQKVVEVALKLKALRTALGGE
jgi:hypothetical protein